MARIVRVAVVIAVIASLVESKALDNNHVLRALQKREAEGPGSSHNLENARDSSSVKKAEQLEQLRKDDKVEHVATVEDINSGHGNYLFEGDMLLTEEQAEQLAVHDKRAKRQAALPVDSTARWIKTAPIPYIIDASIDAHRSEMIHDALDFWQSNTCLKFKENATGPSQLLFIKGDGCYSHVGRITVMPQQPISIGDRCDYFGIITHEIAHALGIFHHQSRPDRDDYIQIAMQNVPSTWNYNFEISDWSSSYDTPYEYGSSMHYAEKILESHKVQIIANDPRYQRAMGNRNRPTFNDVKIVNLHYTCAAACTAKITCQNEGYQNPSNCSKCICPGGFGGNDCSTVAPPELGATDCGGILNATADWQTLVGQVGENSVTIYKRQKACHWHLKAPTGSKISIKVNYIRGPCSLGCFYGATEIKLGNFTLTGVRMCCSSDVPTIGNLETTSNLAVISAYSQLAVEKFSIQFKTTS